MESEVAEKALVTVIDPMEIPPSVVQEIWSRVRTVDAAFDDRIRDHGDRFVQSFFNGTQYFLLGNFGLASASGMIQGGDANVHFAIWNGDHPFEVVSACREVLQTIFQMYDLVRATSTVGDHNDPAIRLARLLGFKVEGRLRKANLYKGTWYDSLILGILREDVVSDPQSEK